AAGHLPCDVCRFLGLPFDLPELLSHGVEDGRGRLVPPKRVPVDLQRLLGVEVAPLELRGSVLESPQMLPVLALAAVPRRHRCAHAARPFVEGAVFVIVAVTTPSAKWMCTVAPGLTPAVERHRPPWVRTIA